MDPVTRRNFIKSVIAAGATASSVGYLFRGPAAVLGQSSAPGAVERLITLNVNGQMRRVDVIKQETLAMTLRYKLGLTGTKLGCDRAECGACTVLIDDVPHYSCSVLTHTVRSRAVISIEGLENPATGELHPMQRGVVDEQGFQCAFCMPGFIMSAVGFLKMNPNPTRQELAHGVSGNLCRCQDYDKILTALMKGAEYMRGASEWPDGEAGRTPTTCRPIYIAKVTGRANYAEDFRADGMLFTKLLLSPMPHARVRSIDTSGALALPGVKAILTADDLPDLDGAEKALTNEPLYAGEPILAVAAVDEATAAEAIEAIHVDLEPLPLVIDPLDSLRPGRSKCARRTATCGRPAARRRRRAPPAPAPRSRRSSGQRKILRTTKAATAACRWASARGMVVRRSRRRVHKRRRSCSTKPSSCSPPVTTRWKRAARWRTGRTASCICTAPRRASCRTVAGIARWVGIDAAQVVLICEYTGGGFGSKGGGAVSMAIPATAVEEGQRAGDDAHQPRGRELHRPRAHEHDRPRPSRDSRKDGRITALDLFIVQDNGRLRSDGRSPFLPATPRR